MFLRRFALTIFNDIYSDVSSFRLLGVWHDNNGINEALKKKFSVRVDFYVLISNIQGCNFSDWRSMFNGVRTQSTYLIIFPDIRLQVCDVYVSFLLETSKVLEFKIS